MINLFLGYEKRESEGFHVFVSSVLENASELVRIVPLASVGMPQGSNAFTASRFLVPFLMGFQGRAIFMDASDMLLTGDVADLDRLFDPARAVQVVKHPNYQTRHPIKYRGTEMETVNTSYPRKNWASVMLFNCSHPAWREVTPDRLLGWKPIEMLQFHGLKDEEIGSLPDEWNRLVDEGHNTVGAKVMHWTAGIPAFPAYSSAPGAELWRQYRERMTNG